MAMIDVSADAIETLRLSVLRFGFGQLPAPIGQATLAGLQQEAEEGKGAARRAEQSVGIEYKADIIALGPRARGFLGSGELADLLSTVFRERFVLAEQRSCFTSYDEGHHLGPHLDEPAAECAVTVIVCLAEKGRALGSSATGLELRVYGPSWPLDRAPRVIFPSRPGSIVVGRGSVFWHERPMLRPGEHVVALTACYRPVVRRRGRRWQVRLGQDVGEPARGRAARNSRMRRPT
jgi:hypothetical protein